MATTSSPARIPSRTPRYVTLSAVCSRPCQRPWRSSARTSTPTAFGAQFYVPNAPSWGLDNRTVALRVPTGSADAVHRAPRSRCRRQPVPDDGCRAGGRAPWLTNQIEPGAPIEGNSYEQLEQSLPNNLRDALRELDDSEILNKYIDPKYIDIFVACKESELRSSNTRSPTSSTTGTCIPCKQNAAAKMFCTR